MNRFEEFRNKFKEFSDECEAELGIKLSLGTIRYSDDYNFSSRIEAIPAYKSKEQAYFDSQVEKGILYIKKPIECGITNVYIKGQNCIFLGARKGKRMPYPVFLKPDSQVVYIRSWTGLSEFIEYRGEPYDIRVY